MATSLVSTGVQFPDSTIQTTAATAVTPAGATVAGGMIMVSRGGPFIGYAADPTVSNTRNWTFLAAQPSSNSGTVSFTTGGNYTPIYSSYYGGWLTVMSVNLQTNTSQDWICFSKTGIYWVPLLRAPVDAILTGYNLTTLSNRQAPIAVDESNGRIWTLCDYQSVYQIRGVYQTTIGAFGPTAGWTALGTSIWSGSAYSQQPVANSFAYVDMGGVTANSGIVTSGKSYVTGHQVYVCAAGTTTFTNRYTQSGGYPTSNDYEGTMVWNYAGQKAAAFCKADVSPYPGPAYVSGNVNQTWTQAANFTASNYFNTSYRGAAAMSSSYNVYAYNGTTLFYSTSYSGWTSTSPGVGTIESLTHNGTYWILRTTQGMYYSSSATPTGWTACGWVPWSTSSSSLYSIGLRQY